MSSRDRMVLGVGEDDNVLYRPVPAQVPLKHFLFTGKRLY